jgi:hypothetical protein
MLFGHSSPSSTIGDIVYLLMTIVATVLTATGYYAPALVGRRLSDITGGVGVFFGTLLSLVALLFITLLWQHSSLDSSLATLLGAVMWIESVAMIVWAIAPYINRTAHLHVYSRARAWLAVVFATYEIAIAWVYYLH